MEENLFWTIDLEIRNINYQTALLLAFRYSEIDVIKMLLCHTSLNLNAKDENNHTPSMIAVLRNSSEILYLLSKRSHTIDWNIQDSNGNTTAMLAIKTQNENCLEILKNIPNIDWNIGDRNRNTPAIASIKESNTKCFQILLQIKSINWNKSNKHNDSPLTLCFKSDNDVFLNRLLKSEDLQENVENLYRLNIYKQAFSKTMKFLHLSMHFENDEKKSVYQELLFALRNNLNSAIVNILIASVTVEDIKDLVVHHYGQKKIIL